MGKSTKKKNKKITAPKANIQELSILGMADKLHSGGIHINFCIRVI